MIKKILLIILIIFPQLAQYTAAEVFEYRHNTGDKYRILSVVNQDVLVNRRLSHRAEILNRIAVEVTGVENGRGQHRAIFQTSERIIFDASRPEVRFGTAGYQWAREYESVFERDRLGYITIAPQYFMPVVRNVPVFPDRSLRVRETWSAEGHEVHDFRDSFGIAEPYRIPFTANYQFIGEFPWKGVNYPAFSVNYRIDSRPAPVLGWVYPVRITGLFNQRVYWDRDRGMAVAYEETYRITFEMSNRTTFEFRGTAHAEVIESEDMDREQVAMDIAEEIERLDIPDITVRTVEEGVMISLDDIRFHPDSDVMLEGESEKLARIAEILLRYPERDILVAGHAARAPSSVDLNQLSADRARAVADYMISNNVRQEDRIVIRGYGTERPIADNSTEEGRRRNRRVEIILLEN